MQEIETLVEWFPPLLVLLIAAFASGTIVGIDRLRRGSPVGVRTCCLVCAGATTYMAAGHRILEVAELPGDPTRIASQIITGIGFLGAGAIIRHGGGVSGLSSAATVWFLGAIGILIGCNLPITGVLLALTVVSLLSVTGWVEVLFKRRQAHGA